MTDTKVTFLSCYNTVGHTRMYVMTLTSPPSLPLSRPWAGLSMRRFMSSHLLIQGSSLLSVLPYSLSVFWMFKNSTLSVSTSLPTITRILPGHTSHDPCLLSIVASPLEFARPYDSFQVNSAGRNVACFANSSTLARAPAS